MRNKLHIILFFIFFVSMSAISVAFSDSSVTEPNTLQLSLVSEGVQFKESLRPEGVFTTFDNSLPLSGETAAPALPLVTKLIGIPSATRPKVTVALSDAKALPRLDHPLEPVATYHPVIDPASDNDLGDYLEAQYLIDEELYAQNAWYPSKVIDVSDPMTLRGQIVVQIEFTPVQVNLATGEMRWFEAADVTLEWLSGTLDGLSGPFNRRSSPVEDPHFEATLAAVLDNYEEARHWRMARQPTSSSSSPSSSSSSSSSWSRQASGQENNWVIVFEGKGLFKVPLADLEGAGVDMSNPDRLAVFYGSGEQAEEQAVWLDNEYLYLINTRDHGRWSKKTVYTLKVLTSGTGLRMAERSSPPDQATTTTNVPYDLRFEEDTVYRSKNSSTREGERWFWKRLYIFGSRPTDTLSTEFDLPHLTAGRTAEVSTELGPEHDQSFCYQAEVSVNQQSVERTWTNRFEPFGEILAIPANDLSETGNVYTVKQKSCGGNISILLFNAFNVSYQRELVVDDDQLWFDNPDTSNYNYQLSDLSSSNIMAFQTTTASNPQRITDGTTTGSGPYSFNFGRPATSGESYLITTLEAAQAVDSITLHESSGLRDELSQTDYLIITHPDFADAMQPLAEYRAQRGLTTRVVKTSDIYQDFGNGTTDPEAIREFIKYAYQNWQSPAVSYVILVGDATYDPFNIQGTSDQIWLPPMLVDKDVYLGEIPADNAFVAGLDPSDLSDDPIADVYISRLPANTAEQAHAMVQKILHYENNSYYNWRRNVLFTTDDPDAAGNFYNLSDHLTDDMAGGLDLIPNRLNLEKAYLRSSDTPYDSEVSVRDKIIESMNDGLLIMQYIGHSARTQWASTGGIWSLNRGGVSDISLLEPNNRLPFSLPWTCWVGYFVTPGRQSMSEEMMRLPNAGVIASFAPTGLDVATGHDYMTVQLYQALFRDETPTTQLGPLVLRAKMGLTGRYQRMWYTYMLYGDPAMNLLVDPCIYDENMTCAEDGHLYLPNTSP